MATQLMDFELVTLPSSLEIELDDIRGHVLDSAVHLTPRRFRFLDCQAFVDGRFLLREHDDLHAVSYAALSYVWRGQSIDPPTGAPCLSRDEVERHGFLHVRGADKPGTDMISLLVLRHVCLAALQLGARYLWMDRLCIIQTGGTDKPWHIQRIHAIFRACSPCIILPGGVQRLVALDEETSWIHRAWTLQEALAPRMAMVLFAWGRRSGTFHSDADFYMVTEVVEGQSAVTLLQAVSGACAKGVLRFFELAEDHTGDVEERGVQLTCCVLGSQTPNVHALNLALSLPIDDDLERCRCAIWQCALMRTSNRPIDMVYSIMGLFGVTLDSSDFQAGDPRANRVKGTIQLAKGILANGGRATWLGIAAEVPLSCDVCTFPTFPRTDVAGLPHIELGDDAEPVPVWKLMDGTIAHSDPTLPLPRGTMDDEGYFTFSSRAATATQMQSGSGPGSFYAKNDEPPLVLAGNGSTWRLDPLPFADDVLDSTSNYAIFLGVFVQNRIGFVTRPQRWFQRGMLVSIRDPSSSTGTVLGFFEMHMSQSLWMLRQPERCFRLGGPAAPLAPQESDRDSLISRQERRRASTLGGWGSVSWDMIRQISRRYLHCPNSS